ARVFENPAGGLEAERLNRLALDPGLAHALDDGVRGVVVQLKFGRQQDRVVEIAPAVRKAEFVALADLEGAGRVQDLGPVDVLADLPGAVARVTAQGPANRPGNTDQGLQAAQGMAGRLGDERGQDRPGAGTDPLAVHLDLGERRSAEAEDGAG